MNKPLRLLFVSMGIILAQFHFAHAEEAVKPPLPLIDVAQEGSERRLVTNTPQVSVVRSPHTASPGMIITIQPGPANYPGVTLKPENGATWDLSAYGHVEARIVNLDTEPLTVSLRVDDAGEPGLNPWSVATLQLKPGTTGLLNTTFGYVFGKAGYALKPAAITRILLFIKKTDRVQSFRVEFLQAAGPAGEKLAVDPKSIRIKPKDGIVLGGGVAIDAAKQIEVKGAAQATVGENQSVTITQPVAAKEESFVRLKPPVGRWDLADGCVVKVKLKNNGSTPVIPQIQLESDRGATGVVTSSSPLTPGAETEIVVPFAATVPWKVVYEGKSLFSWSSAPGTGTKFISDAVSAVKISLPDASTVQVSSIRLDAPPVVVPKWVGTRPPVEGDWVKTFDDNFDGTSLDLTKWNCTGFNWYDKVSHWTKDSLIVSDGTAKMRYEKKTGFHNDDPKGKQTNYAVGYLDTYGKWVQRYGYFETRIKVPKAPGMWPAFWLMPERGVKAEPQSIRQDTGKGATEFDIFEQLTRWGPYRTNIAMHWDGYEKEHKQTGSETVYFQHDAEGFVTVGLLWTPGSAVYYYNGKEVLRWEDSRISSVQSDMMFTMPTGGWDNNALDDAQLPADLVIDYVRVWQRKDLASPVDGPQPKE